MAELSNSKWRRTVIVCRTLTANLILAWLAAEIWRRKMSDDKKPPQQQPSADDKKYAQVWREFVRHCGDAVGFDAAKISPEIAALLAEDSNYRLREAVHNAGQFMRHAKRKKLTNADFNNALRWSDVEPVYGFSSVDPLPFVNVKEAEVFCSEDHEINLVVMATRTHAYENPGVPSVKAHWMAVEGIQKSDLPPLNGPSNSAVAKKSGVVVPTVSDNLMSYYNQVTKAILGNNEEVTKMALQDLETNSRITPLLPFFINFVCVGVKKVSHDLNQLTKLLHTVRSLTDNQFMYLGPKPLLKMLVQGVMYCIVEPLAASLNPINDHWALRDYAARLLANIVRLWSTPVNQLYKTTLDTLKDVFMDLTKPFCSHYGAVIAIVELGIEPVRACIYPNVARYWSHLTVALEDSSLSNVPFKSDANKVYGALLVASEFLVLHEQRRIENKEVNHSPKQNDVITKPPSHLVKREVPPSEPSTSSSSSSKKKFSIYTAYGELYDYFGDALAMRLPCVRIANFYAPRLPRLTQLFTSPELMQTGEELLETFNVKDEEVQSNSIDDDRYSYSSDDQPAVDVDLRIKSTVSDPALGIKLTIAKLPRTTPQPPSDSEKVVKKFSIKISKEQLSNESSGAPVVADVNGTDPLPPEAPFEWTVIKRFSMLIELNFDGSMPVPRHLLKRKRIEEHPFNCQRQENMTMERVYKTSLKMKNVTRVPRNLRFHDVNYERAIRISRTGDISSII